MPAPARAGMTKRERISFVEQALAIERGDDGRAELRARSFDLLGRSRPRAPPPARMIGRSARASISAARAIASAGTAGFGSIRKRRQLRSGSGRPFASSPGAERGRPGGAVPTSSLEKPAPEAWDIIMPAHGAAPLCHRPKDPLEVDFMIVAALAIEGVGVDLPGKQEDRERIGPALGNAGKRVGRARSGGRAHDPGLARHPGIAIGGERAGLLVADQRRADRPGPAIAS